MRLPAITTLLAAALWTEQANAAYCTAGQASGSLWIRAYSIQAFNVADIPGVCGGLWDNLKRFPDCIGISAPACWDETGSGTLRWRFNVGTSCNSGMVNSAWWEATRNQWGSINCYG